MTRFVMSTDRAVELAIRAAEIALGGEVFVFKMPAARLEDLVRAAIEVVAPTTGRDPAVIATRTIDARPGEKAYEELMTEDESSRATDVGDMYAVLPSIEVPAEVAEGYRGAERAPIGAYRSDGVPALDYDEVVRLVRETYGRDETELVEAARG